MSQLWIGCWLCIEWNENNVLICGWLRILQPDIRCNQQQPMTTGRTINDNGIKCPATLGENWPGRSVLQLSYIYSIPWWEHHSYPRLHVSIPWLIRLDAGRPQWRFSQVCEQEHFRFSLLLFHSMSASSMERNAADEHLRIRQILVICLSSYLNGSGCTKKKGSRRQTWRKVARCSLGFEQCSCAA